MLIFAVETSSQNGSLCIYDSSNDEFLFEKQWPREKSHSEVVTAYLEEALNTTKMNVEDFDRLACGIGPGSFTGIRVGLNLVKALAYTKGQEIYGVSSLRALGYASREKDLPICIAMNAFKNLLFVARLKPANQSLEVLEAEMALTLDQLREKVQKPHRFLGDAHEILKKRGATDLLENLTGVETDCRFPKAHEVAKLASTNDPLGDLTHWKNLKPLYVRASEAEENLRKGILKPMK